MDDMISIIVPIFNEEDTIPLFYEAVKPVLSELNMKYEVIFVDDGSTDNSLKILKNLSNNNKNVKIISFSRNFGQQNAIFTGLEKCNGDACVIIDVDLQDPVEVIPLMIEKWKQGYDVVHGRRKARRGESFFKKITSKMYISLIRKTSKLNIPKGVGEFKLLDRKVIDTINAMPEHDKYLRGITAWVGFKQTYVAFTRNERIAGQTKYSVKKLIKLGSKSITTTSTWPLTLSCKLGCFGILSSLLCYPIFIIVSNVHKPLPLIAWLFPTLVILFSISYLFNGISNVYLAKTYEECKNRPKSIIAETINFDEK